LIVSKNGLGSALINLLEQLKIGKCGKPVSRSIILSPSQPLSDGT